MLQQHLKNNSLRHHGVNALLLGVRGSGPHPDGYGYPETFFSTTLLKNHSLGDLGVNALHLGVQGSGPHPGGHVHQETTELTYFITPNKMCFNNVTKNSFLGTPWGQCPTPGCPRVWTSPRWSWTSRNSLKQLLSSYLTTFVSTILPKNHSL